MCAWITLGWQFLYDVENVEWHTACAQSTNIPPAIPTDTERENALKWRMRITYRIEKANIYYILVCLLGFWGPCRASTLVARALAVVVPASRQDNLMFNIIFSETMRRQKKKIRLRVWSTVGSRGFVPDNFIYPQIPSNNHQTAVEKSTN